MTTHTNTPVAHEHNVGIVGPSTDDRAETAATYHLRGWRPIRAEYPQGAGTADVTCSCGKPQCRHPGKHPVGSWRRFQDEAPTAQEVLDWFSGDAPYNIALVQGAGAGTIVLDWDGPEGLLQRRMLEETYGHLPSAPTVRTPGGGEHQLFAHPGITVPTR